MLDLAINYGTEPVSIKSISERQNISEYYLEQLFSLLRKENLIVSIRGAQGGYILSREPKLITIREVLDVLEGPVEISDCIDESTCDNIDCCATRLLWVKIKESVEKVTESITLQDMLDDYNKMKDAKRSVETNE